MKSFLLVMLLLCPIAAHAGRFTCTNVAGRGTLGFISTTEPLEPPTATFIDEGEGGDPDVCLTNPSICAVGFCPGSSACDIDNVEIGACYDYMLTWCTGGMTVSALEYVSAGPCP